jgi:hypothetical protein
MEITFLLRVSIFYFTLGFITTLLFSIALISVNAMVFFGHFWASYGSLRVWSNYNEDAMRFMLYLTSLLLIEHACLASSENPLYTYPVAVYERFGNPHMLVLKQWSLENLELYGWNMTTGDMTKVLMSSYVPSAVTMLPDQSGFSFVDNGRIRIKRFEKRAVKSLDIYDPVYGIELIRWLDSQTCYFHAQADGRYGIYMLTLEEELTPILIHKSVDYTYPTIIENDLFYIERRIDNKKKQSFSIGTCSIASSCRYTNNLVNFGTKPLIMLQMVTAYEGFVIECDVQQELYTFHYHHLTKSGSNWQRRELFPFQVPQEFFIDGPKRLYESLLPLAPRAAGDGIYFSSYDKQIGRLALYRFSLQAGHAERIAGTSGHLFTPVFLGKLGWAGGTTYPFAAISF